MDCCLGHGSWLLVEANLAIDFDDIRKMCHKP